MRRLVTRLLDLLYPRACANCGRIGESSWCSACLESLTADRFRPIERTLDDRLTVIAGGSLDGVLRKAIHAFKFDGARELAGVLGAIVDEALIAAGVSADIVVPVPLHPRRERWRGYNQSALLALAVAANLNAACDVGLLSRTRYTAPQVGRDARSRREAVDGAFLSLRESLAGLRVLLIDDVVTTGSTLSACGRALYAAGAETVTCACVASA